MSTLPASYSLLPCHSPVLPNSMTNEIEKKRGEFDASYSSRIREEEDDRRYTQREKRMAERKRRERGCWVGWMGGWLASLSWQLTSYHNLQLLLVYLPSDTGAFFSSLKLEKAKLERPESKTKERRKKCNAMNKPRHTTTREVQVPILPCSLFHLSKFRPSLHPPSLFLRTYLWSISPFTFSPFPLNLYRLLFIVTKSSYLDFSPSQRSREREVGREGLKVGTWRLVLQSAYTLPLPYHSSAQLSTAHLISAQLIEQARGLKKRLEGGFFWALALLYGWPFFFFWWQPAEGYGYMGGCVMLPFTTMLRLALPCLVCTTTIMDEEFKVTVMVKWYGHCVFDTCAIAWLREGERVCPWVWTFFFLDISWEWHDMNMISGRYWEMGICDVTCNGYAGQFIFHRTCLIQRIGSDMSWVDWYIYLI